MLGFLTSVDFYSLEVYFTINNGSKRNKTLFGGILSVLSLIAMAALCLYFCLDFFKGAKSSVLSRDLSTEDLRLPLDRYPFMLRLSTEKVATYKERDRLYSITLKLKVGGGNNSLQWTEDIQMEPCDIDKHFGEFKGLFNSIEDLYSFVCPEPRTEKQNIAGVYGGEQVFQYYHFYISSCVNSTDRKDCFSKEEIDMKLKATYLDVRSVDYNIDSSTRNGAPYSIYVRSDRHSISNSVYKRIWMYMESIDYYKDLGLVFEDNVEYSFYKVDSFRYDTDIRDIFNGVTTPGTFANLSVLNKANRKIYNQQYEKAQEFFATMGGIIKIIMVIGMILNYFVSETRYQEKIMDYFFQCKSYEPSLLNQTINSNTALTTNNFLRKEKFSVPNIRSPPSNLRFESHLKRLSFHQSAMEKKKDAQSKLNLIDRCLSRVFFSKEKQKLYATFYFILQNLMDISCYIQLKKNCEEIKQITKLNSSKVLDKDHLCNIKGRDDLVEQLNYPTGKGSAGP